MSVFDFFSKRQKALRGESPDVYHYNTIPDPLRVQVIHIWRETLGNEREYENGYCGTKHAYELIVEALCGEYGLSFFQGSEHLVTGTISKNCLTFCCKSRITKERSM